MAIEKFKTLKISALLTVVLISFSLYTRNTFRLKKLFLSKVIYYINHNRIESGIQRKLRQSTRYDINFNWNGFEPKTNASFDNDVNLKTGTNLAVIVLLLP